MPELAAVMVNLETDDPRQGARRKAEDSGRIEKSLTLRMEMSSSSFHGEVCSIKQKTVCLSPEFKKAELEMLGGSLSVESEDGTEFLSVTMTEGGGES